MGAIDNLRSIKGNTKIALGQSLIIAFLAFVLSFGIQTHAAITQTSDSASTLIQASKKYYDLGQFNAATISLEEALQIYRAKENKTKEARILGLLSLTYERLGRKQLAKETIDESLAILEKAPRNGESDRTRAQTLNRLGRWQLAQGRGEKSLATFNEAAFLYTQAGDLQGKAISKLNQAQAWQTLGFSRRATKILDELVQQLKNKPPMAIQLSILNSLGNAYRHTGNLERSEQILIKALTLAKDLHLNLETSKILLNLGNTKLTEANIAKDSDDFQRATDYQQKALEYYQQAEEIAAFPASQVQAQLNQFTVLVENRRWTEAQGFLQSISINLPRLSASRFSIFARINFANSLIELPSVDQEKIIENLNVAIAQSRELVDKRGESAALGTLGQFYETIGQAKLAKQLTISATEIANNIYAPDLDYEWQWQLGRLLTKENDKQAAIGAYEESIRDLQLLRFDIASTNSKLQFSFRDSVEPIYRQYIDLLLRSAQPSQDNLQKSIEVLEELKVAELNNLFRDACAQADNVDISQLDDNTAVIYPIVLPDRLELILKLPNRDRILHYSQGNVSESELNSAVKQLQRSLVRRSTSPQKLKQQEAQFYNWLIEPFASELETAKFRNESQIKNLTFVLDGALRNIPMSALYNGQNYLIARYGVAVSPGVKLVAPQSIVRQNLKVLLAGAVYSPSFKAQKLAPLDNVAVELEGIAQTIKHTEQLADKRFLKTNIQEQINNESFNVVHIATHGKFSSNSQDTYILDWNKAIGLTELDRLLEAEDFDKAKAIDLLVLSACETATGDRQAALGLAGVAVRSGASSTIASLWQVNDASTAQFMIELYRQLNNSQLTKSEALRNVQLDFIAKSDDTDYNRPYHWASFILVGDWR